MLYLCTVSMHRIDPCTYLSILRRLDVHIHPHTYIYVCVSILRRLSKYICIYAYMEILRRLGVSNQLALDCARRPRAARCPTRDGGPQGEAQRGCLPVTLM